MKFSAMVAPRIDDWKLAPFIENLGYDAVWASDSQMIWSDTYAWLALAAANTSRIRLGTGVAIAPIRLAPVTAHSIATINRLAPGRTFLALGTGHTAMRVMGMDPMKAKPFREYLRVVRALLHGEEVSYELDGVTRDIRFLHTTQGFIDVEHPVPLYVAANGPLALKATGAFGDGRVSSHNEPRRLLEQSLAKVREGAAEVGRTLPDSFHNAALGYACVLRPGEKPTSDRVIDACGAMALCSLHYWWEIYTATGDASMVSKRCENEWDAYLDFVSKLDLPPEKHYQRVHLGHACFVPPEERRFVTENLIAGSGGLVGEPDDIIAILRERERTGLDEIALMPAMDSARENLTEFAGQVISRY
ncbi:MAG: LLM class flavin-dependent oxidoreductase [Pseudomonadota bacterium]|nr:LLM class flavin-dependent oxidoreductase [Pseudomonadota bacterium]